jgi:hypothetical protein
MRSWIGSVARVVVSDSAQESSRLLLRPRFHLTFESASDRSITILFISSFANPRGVLFSSLTTATARTNAEGIMNFILNGEPFRLHSEVMFLQPKSSIIAEILQCCDKDVGSWTWRSANNREHFCKPVIGLSAFNKGWSTVGKCHLAAEQCSLVSDIVDRSVGPQ